MGKCKFIQGFRFHKILLFSYNNTDRGMKLTQNSWCLKNKRKGRVDA